jgi:hypothetical protein
MATGSTVQTLSAGAGLIAATRRGEGAPVWLVTGTDGPGVELAARAFDQSTLQDRFAVALGPAARSRYPRLVRTSRMMGEPVLLQSPAQPAARRAPAWERCGPLALTAAALILFPPAGAARGCSRPCSRGSGRERRARWHARCGQRRSWRCRSSGQRARLARGLTVFARLGDLGPFGQGDLTVEALVYGAVIALKVTLMISSRRSRASRSIPTSC